MKKIIALTLATTLMLSLAACTKEPPVPLKYKNGDYTAQFSGSPDGYDEYIKLSIVDDIITITEFDGADKDGNLKSADSALREEMEKAQSEHLNYKANPKKAYTAMVGRFAAAEGDISAVDCVAGATRTSKAFFVLMDAVLEGPALTGDAQPAIIPWLADGTYKVTAAGIDENDYKEFVEITVTDGIAKVSAYDAIGAENAKRSEDVTTKFTIKQDDLKKALTEAFDKAKTPAEIETVAGATRSTNTFKELTAQALFNANTRGSTDMTMSQLKNGIYRAEMSDFNQGWKDYVVASVIDGDIKVLEFDAKNEKGSLKTSDSEFAKSIESASADKVVPTLKPADYHSKIATNFENASGDVLKMDNLAGATVSSNTFKLMMGQLKGYNMTVGDTATLVVTIPEIATGAVEK